MEQLPPILSRRSLLRMFGISGLALATATLTSLKDVFACGCPPPGYIKCSRRKFVVFDEVCVNRQIRQWILAVDYYDPATVCAIYSVDTGVYCDGGDSIDT